MARRHVSAALTAMLLLRPANLLAVAAALCASVRAVLRQAGRPDTV